MSENYTHEWEIISVYDMNYTYIETLFNKIHTLRWFVISHRQEFKDIAYEILDKCIIDL